MTNAPRRFCSPRCFFKIAKRGPPAVGRKAMKIVVFGPGRRTGALRDGMVVDLCGAFAKYALERLGETNPMALAGTLVPFDLARFIEGGERTLENAEKALDYILGE